MKTLALLGAAAIAFTASAAPAAPIVIDFEGLNGQNYESVNSYYSGGSGSLGSTGGPNYGITFSSNTIVGCTAGNPCSSTNSAGNPSGSNVAFFQSGSAATMNVAGGFTTGFSFFYSAVNNPALVRVYDGLNGTGNVLLTLNLPTTPNGANLPGCQSTSFCPYVAIGATFAGTALSVDFGGAADQVGFDDITLGSQIAGGGVPEPATWALMILGMGAVGGAMRRRQSASAKVRFA